jgi:cytochrome c peroxidase
MNTSDAIFAALATGLLGAIALATAQTSPPLEFDIRPPASLKTVAVPEPPNLSDFVADKAAAIRLGKALFWDMQIGSDGATACASCHFSAGADSRSKNQLNPGLLNRLQPDKTFSAGTGANFDLSQDLDFFPLRRLLDESDRGSGPRLRTSGAVWDTNDVVSSQGVFNGSFVDTAIIAGIPIESMLFLPDPDGFQAGNPLLNVRRVEPRHTPSVINAVFNHRQFWDGRAQNEFNGVNNWGDRDPNAALYKVVGGKLTSVNVRLINSSLASQAVAPIVNAFEMAAGGRTTADLGNKLAKQTGKNARTLRPLAYQMVDKTDSVLGSLSNAPAPGLKVADYQTLIQAAFRKEWWQSTQVVSVTSDSKGNVISVKVLNKADKDTKTDEYSQLEYNFSLFFGLAIQLYQSTLVSNETPYDTAPRECEGIIRGPANTINAVSQDLPCLPANVMRGLKVFVSQDKVLPNGSRIKNEGARCINCHAGAELTDASITTANLPWPSGTVTRQRENQFVDRGFNNIGVRTTIEDISVGGSDPFGTIMSALSSTRRCKLNPGLPLCPPVASAGGVDLSSKYIAVDGAFKVPGLRNVELTPPYFHNGGYLTLESVIQFYSRGGDFGCSTAGTSVIAPFDPAVNPGLALCRTANPNEQPLTGVDGTEIRPLGIPGISSPTPGLTDGKVSPTDNEQADLLAFLQALTDERVRYHKAPFDHPQLFIPNGQLNDHKTTKANPYAPALAMDRFISIPAVGAQGYSTPLPGFLKY